MRKAFVLLSGGLDSTVALAIASRHDWEEIECVSINYGQRHKREITMAHFQSGVFGAKHTTLQLGDLLAGSSLLTSDKELPDVKYDEIKGVSPMYVPFRNGLMLSVLTAHAQKWVDTAEFPVMYDAGIYFGAHAEDAHNWAYPDCTPEFIGAMANAIFVGSYQRVRLHTPLMWMRKSEIVRIGFEMGVRFEKTWSCYKGGQQHCGACATCYARQEAFARAGVPDPTDYAVPRKAA